MSIPSTMLSHEECQSGFLLNFIFVLDSVGHVFRYPNWRESMPFGLGETYLSHEVPNLFSMGEYYPKLPSYAEFLSDHKYENNLSSLYKFAFETPSTALGDLMSKDALVTLFILVLILRQMKSFLCPLFSSLGRNLARTSHGPEWVSQNDEKIYKFGEYSFRLMYHFGVSVYGIMSFMRAPWWDPAGTADLWRNYPHQPIEPKVVWFYLLQGAYNVDALSSLIQLSFVVKLQNPFGSKNKAIQSPVSIKWSPTCRGDFSEMAVHHLLTNCLVFFSSNFRMTRPGIMVFMVHDISDVPVDMSKLANFMKWKITTIICFVTMVLVWAVTRLGILPFVFFKSVVLESYLVVPGVDTRIYYMVRPLFYALVVGIIALHFFWFHIFLKIGYNLVFKKEIHDLSEHKGGEEQQSKKRR